jgi:hypothetical protein
MRSSLWRDRWRENMNQYSHFLLQADLSVLGLSRCQSSEEGRWDFVVNSGKSCLDITIIEDSPKAIEKLPSVPHNFFDYLRYSRSSSFIRVIPLSCWSPPSFFSLFQLRLLPPWPPYRAFLHIRRLLLLHRRLPSDLSGPRDDEGRGVHIRSQVVEVRREPRMGVDVYSSR